MIESEATSQKTYLAPELKIGWGYYIATTTPTANDDATQGFGYGSHWYKQSVPYRLWICTDNSDSAAVWKEIPLTDSRHTRTIFDRFADAATTGTTRETLYTDEVLTYTLFETGDKVFFRYAGRFAANANAGKYVILQIAGEDISSSEQSSNDGSWEMDGFVIRVSDSVLRFEAEFTTTGQPPDLLVGEVTGLDLDNDPVPFLLDARSAVATGDVIAKMGTAWFMPAAPVVAGGDVWGLLGDSWALGGDEWGFNP